jgi:hypothetical protein
MIADPLFFDETHQTQPFLWQRRLYIPPNVPLPCLNEESDRSAERKYRFQLVHGRGWHSRHAWETHTAGERTSRHVSRVRTNTTSVSSYSLSPRWLR